MLVIGLMQVIEFVFGSALGAVRIFGSKPFKVVDVTVVGSEPDNTEQSGYSPLWS